MSAAVPVLAHVRLSSGLMHVPYAENYLGFLVQRRYRRVPVSAATLSVDAALTGDFYEPYFHPYLHPGLVAQAGFAVDALYHWLAEHPGEIFTHPQYSALCLRWGLNPLGCSIEAYKEPLPAEKEGWDGERIPLNYPLYFKPHSVWTGTGRTYYHLQQAAPATDTQLAKAGLHWHEANQEGEGEWTGWYTHDWKVAHSIAAAAQKSSYAVLGPLPALPVHHLHLYHAPGVLREEVTEALPELAWAAYAAAPAVAEAGTPGEPRRYPRLVLSRRGPTGQFYCYAEKAVLPTTSLATLPQAAFPYLAPHLAWAPLSIPLPMILEPEGRG